MASVSDLVKQESPEMRYFKGSFLKGYTFADEIIGGYCNSEPIPLRENFEYQLKHTHSKLRKKGLEYLLSTDYPDTDKISTRDDIKANVLIYGLGAFLGLVASIVTGLPYLAYSLLKENREYKELEQIKK